MKKEAIFFLILLLTFNIPLIYSATEEGYGEGNDNLGQFTDSFENDDNVTVMVNVINNVTLECMELYFTSATKVFFDPVSAREWDWYPAKDPRMAFSVGGNDYIQVSSDNLAQGRGVFFLTINREWLKDKYIRWSWQQYQSTGTSRSLCYFELRDYEHDRTNDNDFPEGTYKGWLLEYKAITVSGAWSGWLTEDRLMDNLTLGIYTNCTAMFIMHDAWNSQNIKMQIDWIEINEGAGGTDNLITINFEDATNLVMEQLGTQDDYGYVNNTGLPFRSGGFAPNGYFITEDYLNYTTGNSLALLTNTSIPEDTLLTVEFSNDNITWALNDWEPMFGGLEAIDLRDLNYTDLYLRYNFTGTVLKTPRLYQSRLVTTNGTGGVGGIVYITTGINSSGILIVIFLLTIGSILVYGVYRRK